MSFKFIVIKRRPKLKIVCNCNRVCRSMLVAIMYCNTPAPSGLRLSQEGPLVTVIATIKAYVTRVLITTRK